MSRRTLNLGFALGVAILLAFIASKLLGGGGAVPTDALALSPSPPVVSTPTPSPVARPVSSLGEVRTYAIKVVELQGLPPDVAPGAQLEMWVAWEPPITRRPRYQLLLERVTLERIVPALTPEGPATALLRVKNSDVPALLYGDRYGALSVTVLPGAG